MFFIFKASTLSFALLPPLALTAPHASLPLMPNLLDRDTNDTSSIPVTTYIPPVDYIGDVINVTKCYCEDPTSGAPGGYFTTGFGWGHYYQADYYNFHLRRLYSIAWTCHSLKLTKAIIPTCWDSKHNEKEGKRFPDGNVFSYKVGSDGIWGDGHGDHYYFNDQKRSLPTLGPGILNTTPEACEGYCKDHVQGMVAAREPDAPDGEFFRIWYGQKGQLHRIESSITTFNDTDDMCDTCK